MNELNTTMNKIKLIFSVGYDSHVYKTNKKLFNKKFVGELQLLGLLERELGLSGIFKSNKERQAEYLEYLTKTIGVKDVFISKSFSNDNIGVANELLKWRDQLKLSNWNFKEGISDRLNVLVDIENEFTLSPGISDRWILILNKLKTTSNINIESIEIHDNLELLHPIYKEVFGLLQDKGVAVSIKDIKIETPNGSNLSKIKESLLSKTIGIELDKADKSFQVIRFKDSVIASDFLAQQLTNNQKFPVIINSNNYGLDTSFTTFNLPISGSEINNTNPQIIQLFKLVSALLFSKVNPYNLLSLLNLPELPFSKSLAKKLSKVLISNGGIGNTEWLETINMYKSNLDKDRSNWKESIKAVELYLERERLDEISKDELINIYREIATWSSKSISFAETENTKAQLYNLQMLSKSFVKTIESINQPFFTARALDKIINKVYEPITINVNSKEKGSSTVLTQATQLYSNADTLVWFDFYNQKLSSNFCDFLMQSEIIALKEQENILYWSKENQIQLQLDNFLKGILKTDNKLCLFIAEKTNGESTTEHPIFTQLATSIIDFENNITDFSFENNSWENTLWEAPKLIDTKYVELPKPCDYLHIEKGALLNKREKESYSSINNLIQDPLDWVMDKQARITEKGLGSIEKLITLKGNLSHIVVQTLLEKEKQGEIDFSTADINTEIDKLLEQFTPQFAAPFYLDENTFDYIEFTNQLKKSFRVLLDIIENNNLKYKAYEYNVEGKINAMDFSGNIDLLFYKDNTPVIIDLKWTFSAKKYAAILEEEKSIQLAMYAKLLNHSSATTAYFLLSHARLYTTSSVIGEGTGVKKIALEESAHHINDRIIKRTINSFDYRWNEFSKGKIELSEELLIEDIEYGSNTESEDLIPLDIADKKFKKANPYSAYGLFKGKVK